MKRKVFILMASAITMMALNTLAQDGQTRPVSDFNSIEAGGPFNVHIKINGTESLKLDVDANILDDIKTEVVDGTLKIGFKNKFNWHHNIKRGEIYITAKSLSGVANSGSGNTDVDGVLTGDKVSVLLSGSGNIRTAVKAGTLESKISGSGGINLKGSTGNADFRISGSGGINGRMLSAETVLATISGSGSIDIRANKTVSARIAGSGSVSYTGNAVIGETKYAGSGRINKAD